MATPDELEALARRCETEEASWDLSIAIELAITPGTKRWTGKGPFCVETADQRRYNPPAYASSLDAAVTLVPDEFKNAWSAGDNSSEYRIFASLGYEYETTGLTPALALCAASLRARASLTEKG